MTIMKLLGGGIAFIVTSGFTFFKLYDAVSVRREKREEKKREFERQEAEKDDERRYKRELKLEQDKVTLQKELEATKQRHVQKLIDAVRCEMKKIETEVKSLSTSFARVDERMKVSVETEARSIQMVNDFIQTTTNRFRMMEQEMKQRNGDLAQEFRTEIKKISEDLILVRGIADKVRSHNDRKTKSNKGG